MSNTAPSTNLNFISTPSSLNRTLVSFLTVFVHQILYLRHLYPLRSFLSTRAYNFPVRQSRHPSVCAWILSAITAVEDQLSKATVREVSIVIFGVETNEVFERYRLDLRDLPAVAAARGKGGLGDVPFEREGETVNSYDDDGGVLANRINVADLEAQFRGVLSRLSSACSRLVPLPEDQECSFTIAIEVKEDADRPVGILEKEERKWVAAEPEPWPEEDDHAGSVGDGGQEAPDKTLPVRRLEAGELRMEVWVEESRAKLKGQAGTS